MRALMVLTGALVAGVALMLIAWLLVGPDSEGWFFILFIVGPIWIGSSGLLLLIIAPRVLNRQFSK